MQILMNVPAINNDAYTSLGSSSRLVILLAAECCFVFNTLISLLLRENKATSDPEIIKVRIRSIARAIPRMIFPWALAASRVKEK